MQRVRLKVCCISSIEEARIAVQYGADALGLVAKMPSGPGVISDELITEIAAWAPPPVATFLLTSETAPDVVVDHVRRTRPSTVQLVDDDIPAEVYPALRDGAPGVRVVQVIHVQGESSVDRALEVESSVDALLLDSGAPGATVRELGGTGRIHDWSVSRKIVEQSTKPVFVAGGLTPENVADAITATQPFGIDLCSGVRTDGRLDARKLQQLVNRIGHG